MAKCPRCNKNKFDEEINLCPDCGYSRESFGSPS